MCVLLHYSAAIIALDGVCVGRTTCVFICSEHHFSTVLVCCWAPGQLLLPHPVLCTEIAATISELGQPILDKSTDPVRHRPQPISISEDLVVQPTTQKIENNIHYPKYTPLHYIVTKDTTTPFPPSHLRLSRSCVSLYKCHYNVLWSRISQYYSTIIHAGAQTFTMNIHYTTLH